MVFLLNGVLHYGFTILLKKWAKKMEEGDDAFLRKKSRRKTKQYYHNTSDITTNSDTCRWKRDTFSSEVEITRGID